MNLRKDHYRICRLSSVCDSGRDRDSGYRNHCVSKRPRFKASNLARVRRRSTADSKAAGRRRDRRQYRCRRFRAPVPRSRSVRSWTAWERGVSTIWRLAIDTALEVRTRRKPPFARGSKSRSSSSRPPSIGHVSAQADTTSDRPDVGFTSRSSVERNVPRTRGKPVRSNRVGRIVPRYSA